MSTAAVFLLGDFIEPRPSVEFKSRHPQTKPVMQSDRRSLILPVVPVVLCILLAVSPGAAFTAESLTITVKTDGDARAEFDYTLEGLIENAIPESMLEEELVKGLSTSDEPPEVIAFDKSGATLLLKNFAQLSDTSTGTEYLTASMDFSKAEIALQDSAVSSVITADFTPQITTVIFPDGYNKVFTDSSTLPSIRHVVVDPLKNAEAATTAATPALKIKTRATVKSTMVATPAAVAPAADDTPVVPITTTPSSGLPVTVTVLSVLGLAGAGTYYYAVRKE